MPRFPTRVAQNQRLLSQPYSEPARIYIRRGLCTTTPSRPSVAYKAYQRKPEAPACSSQIARHGRAFTTTTPGPNMASSDKKKDWSATQYLKFGKERTRAVYDLVNQIVPVVPCPSSAAFDNDQLRIYDLGCGPGNSTAVLSSFFPRARITGMDSSPDMLERAKSSLARSTSPLVDFVRGDVETFSVAPDTDVIFSNAVFHWLRTPSRLPTLQRLFEALKPGAVLAIQVPDNYYEPSHSLMRTTATLPASPWSRYFAGTRIGHEHDATRPDLDPMEPPAAFYKALAPHAASLNLWRTTYQHVVPGAAAIVEWVKGTGLQPYLNRIPDHDQAATHAFLAEYEKRLKHAYPDLGHGSVLLAYPRFFVVAVRAPSC